MGWGDPYPNKFGGSSKNRTDRGKTEKLYGKTVNGDVSRSHHVHTHKDGMTLQNGKEKYTLRMEHCPYCKKSTRHRWETSSEMKCLTCNSWHSWYPE